MPQPAYDPRLWTAADRQAGVIPIAALRQHGKEALAIVEAGRRLTVLRYGRAVALLVPITQPPSVTP